ncbi:hypothetical protein [Nodularia spumigena]|uniref:hypothetical protein n=1 Tax=Nodularia spumigena TaxID=70799 RepID=UPI00232FE9BF|nr:hypothetical protein [Nodularia spumigena]MDB9338382.1 hypothetical protein [Nodularia spumigena CS-589/07]MDB9355944.1 hypothetical protein [Nodularia spumigena CS-587/03]MDB9497252.1 hypothetical protein [Nodularia spumigena CS-336/02]MDB9533160.1 hypothetical protein [Nodularia spumigena CS-1038]
MEVVFKQKYSWSILPFKQKVDLKLEKQKSQIYEQNFRWFRRSRVAELCVPWRLANEIGWIIPSPVDITLTPIHDIEISCAKEEISNICKITGTTELWNRDNSYFAIQKASWLRLYDFQTPSGWESMFIINGQGSVEWRLGWEIQIPTNYYIMIMPLDSFAEINIVPGILESNILERINHSSGISIAINPQKNIVVKRGQAIARVILLHADSLTAKTQFDAL